MRPDPSLRHLTRREREVALLVADGLKNAAIARQLGISPSTVATHVQHIQARLDLGSRVEIADWVIAHGESVRPERAP
jgi:DNA-binding NarL/FixJ family response regulator